MNRDLYIFVLKKMLGLYLTAFVGGWMTLFLTSSFGDDSDYYILLASPFVLGMVTLLSQGEFLRIVWGETCRALGALPVERTHLATFLWCLTVVISPMICALGVGLALLSSQREFRYAVPTIVWILACQWIFATGCAAAASLYAWGRANDAIHRSGRARVVRAVTKLAGWSAPILILGGGVIVADAGVRHRILVGALVAVSVVLVVLSYRYSDRTWVPNVDARAPLAKRRRFKALKAFAKPALPVARWYSPIAHSLVTTILVVILAHPFWKGGVSIELSAFLAPLALGLACTYDVAPAQHDARVFRSLPTSRHANVVLLLANAILLFVPPLLALLALRVLLSWSALGPIASFLLALCVYSLYLAMSTRFPRVWSQFLLWFGMLGLLLCVFQAPTNPLVTVAVSSMAITVFAGAYILLYRAIGRCDALYPMRTPYETDDADWI